MTRLIVNADDFGLTPGVDRAALELYRAGALTSATMMAGGKSAADATRLAKTETGLGVGCHVVLVDGSPLLAAQQVPRLTEGGEFRQTLGRFVRDLTLGRILEREIEMEAMAQIRHLQSAGIRVTHLDTHKHTHMFPRVLRPLILAGMQCGVRAIRNPFEPEWAVRATRNAPMARRMQVGLLRTMRREWRRIVTDAGIATTDGAIGVLATGTLNAKVAEDLLTAMPEGTWELVCHPGCVDEGLRSERTRLRESREVERDALARVVPEFLRGHGNIAAIHFGQLRES